MDHEQNMHLALALARDAGENGDVPVGCVIADRDGNIIGCGRNRREEGRDATAHAEIEAIRDACRARGSWRLDDCVLYVTLEPCPMCAGAIINARIPPPGKKTRAPAAASWICSRRTFITGRASMQASAQKKAERFFSVFF